MNTPLAAFTKCIYMYIWYVKKLQLQRTFINYICPQLEFMSKEDDTVVTETKRRKPESIKVMQIVLI